MLPTRFYHSSLDRLGYPTGLTVCRVRAVFQLWPTALTEAF
jgi:hypothetical protein